MKIVHVAAARSRNQRSRRRAAAIGGTLGRPAQVIGRAGRVAGPERGDQSAAREPVVDHRPAADREAVPALGDLQRLLDAVELDRAGERRRREAARAGPFLPLVGEARVDDQPDALQRGERVLVRPQRQVAGRADRQRDLLQQKTRVDPRPGALAVADREIDLVALQVDHPRGRHELQLDVGVRALERAELRDQPGRGERRRQRQADHVAPARAQHGLGRRLDLAQRRVDLLEIAPAGRGQPHAGPGAVEQRDAQKILEPPHLVADRRLGHAQALRGVAEAAVHRGGVKRAQRGERRQRGPRLGHAGEGDRVVSQIQVRFGSAGLLRASGSIRCRGVPEPAPPPATRRRG